MSVWLIRKINLTPNLYVLWLEPENSSGRKTAEQWELSDFVNSNLAWAETNSAQAKNQLGLSQKPTRLKPKYTDISIFYTLYCTNRLPQGQIWPPAMFVTTYTAWKKPYSPLTPVLWHSVFRIRVKAHEQTVEQEHIYKWQKYQSINERINQSNNELINQSINESINEQINQWKNQSINEEIN